MGLEEKGKVLGDFEFDKKKIIQSFIGKEEIKFSELVEIFEVPKTIKKEFNKSKMFSLSKEIRGLMNDRLIKDSKDSIFEMDEVFTITNTGKELILSDEDKIEIEIKRSKETLESYKGIISCAENKIKELETKLEKLHSDKN